MAQFSELQREFDLAREAEVRSIIGRVMELLASRGIGLNDVIRCANAPKSGPIVRRLTPLYWNPETGETWSGRGREPRWLAGRDRAQFKFPSPEPDEHGVSGSDAHAAQPPDQ
ncbi:hypothetical protein WK99_15895 [Burkholderia ubonensis]|nr:hypothetical protein WK99_15895 [Burkholderia ubonensis]